jgi:hypothetical protein
VGAGAGADGVSPGRGGRDCLRVQTEREAISAKPLLARGELPRSPTRVELLSGRGPLRYVNLGGERERERKRACDGSKRLPSPCACDIRDHGSSTLGCKLNDIPPPLSLAPSPAPTANIATVLLQGLHLRPCKPWSFEIQHCFVPPAAPLSPAPLHLDK